jgi:hypothetical protein
MGGEKSRVMVKSNFKADQTPPAIARMFSPPVATARWVLQFTRSAEPRPMLRRRQFLDAATPTEIDTSWPTS